MSDKRVKHIPANVTRLYHGGVPGMKVGDILAGGNQRLHHDGCHYCEMRRDGVHFGESTDHPEDVYCTTDREYARQHASMYGYGDLYRVEPIDGEPWVRSDEDDIETYRTPRLRVAGIVQRAVKRTVKEIRRDVRRREGMLR